MQAEGGTHFFHASGRQRFELSEEASPSGNAVVQLVLIGVGEEGVNEAHDDLAAAAAATEDAVIIGSERATCNESFSAVVDRIHAHDLFSLHEAPVDTDTAEDGQQTKTSSVLFRLTGTERCGHGVDELRDRWHVDFNRLNAQLLAAVNSDSGPAFLSPVMIPSSGQASTATAAAGAGAAAQRKAELWLRHALGGNVSMASWWDECVAREAESIVSRNSAMQAALGAGISCPKGEASLHMMEAGKKTKGIG
eukprot:COSAG02_NODE_4595_length_5181_cov_1.941362_2_plen_251_part_00